MSGRTKYWAADGQGACVPADGDRIVKQGARLGRLCVLALTGLSMQGALAQSSMTPDQEYVKYIDHASSIEKLSDFGDEVNLRDGSFDVRATDIELPGIGPTIRIARTYRPSNMGQSFFETSGNSFGLWELEIPRIKTITANEPGVTAYSPTGWQVVGSTDAEKNARCTRFGPPGRVNFGTDQTRGWNAWEWWNGYHLVDDQGNEQSLLRRSDTTVRSDLKVMTTGNWLVGCLATTSNGQSGEGFYALAPDGTKYWFDYLVYTDADMLQKPLGQAPALMSASSSSTTASENTAISEFSSIGISPMFISDSDQLARRYASMLVTRIEDRFGNWVTYHYTSGRLDSIDASDGRHVGVVFNSSGGATVTAGTGTTARVWTYAFSTMSSALVVTRPDGSTWQYALPLTTASSLDTTSDTTAACTIYPNDYDSFLQGTITSPSGATLTLKLNRRRFARSYVPKQCWVSDPNVDPNPDHGYSMYPREWYAFALVSRTISGPGLTTATWTYNYAPPVSSWYSDCATPTSCTSTVWTDVTDPDGNRRHLIYSNKFDESENKLLREEEYSSSNQLLRATDYAYATAVSSSSNPYPWPVIVGDDLQKRENSQITGQWAPVRQTVITQQGRIFTNVVNAFDAFARPTQVTKSNAPSP